MPIRMHDVSVEPQVHADVEEILRSGRLTQGPFCDRLEETARDRWGVEHALAVANGTVALELAYEALAADRPALAVVPSLTFGATLNAALRRGLRAVLCDVGDDLTMDPASAAAALARGVERWPEVEVAVLCPVHLYGLPARSAELAAVAAAAPVPTVLLGDAAQAHGATVDGASVARATPHATFSFYPTKNVGGAEGGLVTTADTEVARVVSELRNQGTSARYAYDRVGTNARLSELQAAVALRALEVLDDDTAARRAHAAALSAALGGLPGLTVPSQSRDGREGCWHQYVVRVDPGHRGGRDALAAHLEAAGIASDVVYPGPLGSYRAFAGHPAVEVAGEATAAAACAEVLSLPVHRRLTGDDLAAIGAAVRGWATAPR